MGRLLNFAMFYLGWFACVGGAARGQLWLGPAVVAGLLFVHLSLSSSRSEETSLILVAGLLGFVGDTVQASVGLYAFTNTSAVPWLCPPWMVALWMIFATTLNGSMRWLAGRFGLGAVLGAVFGPLSYLAGARLGAIELHANTLVTLAAIAVAWAGAMPALLWLRDVLSTSAASLQLRSPARAL
jgi:uncharacterized protein DUF2878